MSGFTPPSEAANGVAGLASLAAEVLSVIMEDDCLSLKDLAALRLTCASLSGPAAVILFRRIYISPVKQDRTAFEEICRTPHLAQHVREVEWSELAWFHGYFDYCAMTLNNLPRDNDRSEEAADIENAVALLDRICSEVLWLPTVLRPDAGGEPTPKPDNSDFSKREEAIDEYFPIFYESLHLLPNLHTIASRPMAPERVIHSQEYPISASLIQGQIPMRPRSNWNCSSDGLFLFILPAMTMLQNPIRRLVWQDELRGNGAFGNPVPEAFKHLDTLSISLSQWKFFPHEISNSDEVLAGLKTCLKACTSVRHLTLGMENEARDIDWERFCEIPTSLLRYSLDTQRSEWTRLHSLNLVSMKVDDEILVAVIRENAETLRHLYLQECDMSLSRVKKLSTISGLRLRSARILSEYPQHQCHRIPEEKLVDFLNHQTIPEGEDVQMCSYIDEALQTSVDDEDEIHIEQSLYYETHRARIFDDDCPEFFERRAVMTVPVVLVGGASIDDDAVDEKELQNAEHRGDIDDSVSIADSDNTVAERIRNGPKWICDRYCNYNKSGGGIYFSKVPDSHPDGLPTTVWKFTSRDGVVYFGIDPWEGFEEWDPEQGDVEEPLPYSPEMDLAIERLKPPLQGAVAFNQEDAAQARAWNAHLSDIS